MRFIKHLIVATSCLFVFALPAFASAQGVFSNACTGDTAGSTVCSSAKQTETTTDNSFYGPNGVLIKVANIIATVTGVAAVIVIIVSGLRYILSNGESGKVTEAKDAILYALVGLVVIAAARLIIGLVVSKL